METSMPGKRAVHVSKTNLFEGLRGKIVSAIETLIIVPIKLKNKQTSTFLNCLFST